MQTLGDNVRRMQLLQAVWLIFIFALTKYSRERDGKKYGIFSSSLFYT